MTGSTMPNSGCLTHSEISPLPHTVKLLRHARCSRPTGSPYNQIDSIQNLKNTPVESSRIGRRFEPGECTNLLKSERNNLSEPKDTPTATLLSTPPPYISSGSSSPRSSPRQSLSNFQFEDAQQSFQGVSSRSLSLPSIHIHTSYLTITSSCNYLYKSYIPFHELQESEGDGMVGSTFLDSQPDISARERAILVCWLVETRNELCMPLDTLFLASNIVDRYLSLQTVFRFDLKAVAICALRLASIEYCSEDFPELLNLDDTQWSEKELLDMELNILRKLSCYVTVPNVLSFVPTIIDACNQAVGTESLLHENLVMYLLTLSLLHTEVLRFAPSVIAASAVNVTQRLLNRRLNWNMFMPLYCGGLQEADLKACEKILRNIFLKYATIPSDFQLGAVKRMFLSTEWSQVALEAEKKIYQEKYWIL